MAAMIKIEESWRQILAPEFDKPYWRSLTDFIKAEIKAGKKVFPAPKNIFASFDLCPLDKLKVVIIGQDPYHSVSVVDDRVVPTAHGLCFSVVKGAKIPPSLKNIYQELQTEFPRNFKIPTHGNLEKWAEQGILLLNTTLTVEAHRAMSHAGKGWEQFTDKVIELISREKKGVVFLLWGRHAQNKEKLINLSKNFVLKSAHPSPLSARNGFFGCGHFVKTNEILREQGLAEIDWQV